MNPYLGYIYTILDLWHCTFRTCILKDPRTLLSKILKCMANLTTFSFKLAEEGWDVPNLDVPAIPQSSIAKMISCLLGKITNLEIDTARTDIPPDNLASTLNPTNHLCKQIGNLFPQLHYLRLRVNHLCPVLLDFVENWPTWPYQPQLRKSKTALLGISVQ